MLGMVSALWLGARRGVAVSGLAILFGLGALRQSARLYLGDLPRWGADAATFGELAMLGIALSGLLALRSQQRTTWERDRAEDLHWDSMEAVRVMSELAARPGSRLADDLATVLDLGVARFGLDLGVAWQQGDADDDPGTVLCARAPRLEAATRDARVETLLPSLRDAIHATRPVLQPGRHDAGRAVFAVAIAAGGRRFGALGFAGVASDERRFTATDKDLLLMMAQWVAAELERSDRARDPAPAARPAPAGPAPRPARPPTPLRDRRRVDLNHGIERLAPRLRRRVGADGTLSLALADALPPIARGRLSLPRLVESLVDAAAQVSPTGRITVTTVAPTDDATEVTLRVEVGGAGVDAGALERVLAEADASEEAPSGALPLARIERLLRADGGDLSISIEPGHRALLTAWLPSATSRRARARSRPAPRQSSR